MVPTPLAETLAEPVRESLLKIKATVEIRPGFDPGTTTRRFSLMMSDYVSTVLMNEALQRFAHTAPRATFEVVSNDLPTPPEALECGDVDLLIMPQDYLSKDHPAEILLEDAYTCVVWAGNSVVGDRISPEEYLRSGHVCLQFNRGRNPVLDEWFLSRLGVKRRIEIIAMSFNSVPQHIVGTQRVATTHRRLAQYYCRYLPLRIVPCPFDLPPVVQAVQWHNYFNDDPGLAWLRGALKEVVAALPAVSVAHP
jgi:DNA-binding transcriptional LysR family regulator